MSELYIKPLQDYVKDLCQQHALLLHDDANNVVFVKFQTFSAPGDIKNNAANSFVIMDNLVGRAKGEFDENRLTQDVTILFLCRAATPNGTPNEAIENALEKAFEILMDFYVRMKHDYENNSCGVLRWMDATRLNYEPVDGPVLEDHYGWLMTLPIDVKAPAYDPAKWIIP